jgi:peroxiredoxin
LGLSREDIGSARVGKPAPDFAAIDTDGRPFALADAVKESRVLILIFVSADW